MLVDLANATHASGEQVSVCITRTADDLAGDLHPAIPLTQLKRQRRFELDKMLQLDRLARTADLLHVHGRSSFSFVTACKTIGLLRGRPTLLHDHYGIEIDPSVPRWFAVWGRHFVDQYVGVYSRLARWAIDSGVPAARVRWIDNALDFSRLHSSANDVLRRTENIPDDALLGIAVGGIRNEKGFDILVDVLAHLPLAPPWVVCVIGRDADPAYAARVREQARSLGLEERLHFIGERADAAVLMHGADFAVLPSRSESGPLVLIEYLAAGLPVVAFEIGSISAAAAKAGIPGFVPPGDVDAFQQALTVLLNLPPAALDERGQHGARIAETLFTMESRVTEWMDVYRTMIMGGAK